MGASTLWRAAYDGHGIRRKRLDAKGTVHYPGSGYERNVGTGVDTTETVTKHYRALGRLIAIRKTTTPPGGSPSSVLRYVGTDHLGSPIQVTDSGFVALSQGQQRYTPCGVARDSGAGIPTDHLFTSQISDTSIGLYWYASRAYDPALGRFCQPDSLVPSPGDPQSLNRYSYVRNNPLGYTDPSGNVELSANEISRLNELGIVDRLGRPVDARAAASIAFSAVDYVLFVGGWWTNDQADPGGWRAYTSALDAINKPYGFFDWREGWSDTQRDPTIFRSLQDAARVLHRRIVTATGGASRVGLVEHSWGGALVAEFAAQLAEGSRSNPGVVAAITLSAPLTGPQAAAAGFSTFSDAGQDRVVRAAKNLQVRFEVLDNPADWLASQSEQATRYTYRSSAYLGGVPPAHGQLLKDPLAVTAVGTLMSRVPSVPLPLTS